MVIASGTRSVVAHLAEALSEASSDEDGRRGKDDANQRTDRERGAGRAREDHQRLDPKNVRAAADYIGYQPVVTAGMEYVTNETQQAMRPSDEVIEAGVLAEDVGDFQRNYDDAWRQVVSA